MKTHIISLGGSLIVPEKINVSFLKKFRKLIIARVNRGDRFIIVTGGGMTNRSYNKSASRLAKISPTDLDHIGIAATRLNAALIRAIFSPYAFERVIENPMKRIKTNKKIIVGAGWQPGCSSDKDMVLLARQFKAKEIINLFDQDFVYSKDPRKFKQAKPLKNLKWSQFNQLLGPYFPGGNWPFDPIASRLAQKAGLRLVLLNGKNISNLSRYFANKSFKGSVILP